MSKSSITDFLSAARTVVQDGSFVRLTLSGYKGADETLKKLIVRQVLVKQKPHLSFTYQHKTRDITKNLPIAPGLTVIGDALQGGFGSGTLFTTGYDLNWPSLKKVKATYTQAPSLEHDRSKKRVLAAGGQAWMHALGLTGADGKVLQSSQDKFRQINKFLEVIGPLFADITNPRVVDMGSGKGYLTFALYEYLANNLKSDARITGVEDRPDMVALCNDIAFASDFSGLTFTQGRIADFDASGMNVLIALHACDTATDDAIAKGLRAGAQAIIVAPCCHKQIRREMESSRKPADLEFILRHGIFLERTAEMVTDALRALYLELHGYNVKVFEFISDAHTPKNIMIVATRKKTLADTDKIQEKITAAKACFGIERHHLEEMVNGD